MLKIHKTEKKYIHIDIYINQSQANAGRYSRPPENVNRASETHLTSLLNLRLVVTSLFATISTPLLRITLQKKREKKSTHTRRRRKVGKIKGILSKGKLVGRRAGREGWLVRFKNTSLRERVVSRGNC